jgi:hypothetical protein
MSASIVTHSSRSLRKARVNKEVLAGVACAAEGEWIPTAVARLKRKVFEPVQQMRVKREPLKSRPHFIDPAPALPCSALRALWAK